MAVAMDEKIHGDEAITSPYGASLQDGSASSVEFDLKADKALISKIDRHVIPFIMVMYLFSFLDRGRYGHGFREVSWLY